MSDIYGSSTSGTTANVPSKRPASIQELAQRAELSNVWDASKDFKFWLKTAERARHAAQEYDQFGDLENAFVEYSKAATLILEKIPSHRDYHTRLDTAQRETLISKGKGVLDRMGQIKPPLVDRHNAWEAAQARGGDVSLRSQGINSGAKIAQRSTEEHRDQTPSRKSSVNGRGMQIWYPDAAIVAQEKRRRDESQAQALRVRAEQRTRTEQVAILQRQREAEEEARAARRSATPNPSLNSGFVSIPVAAPFTPKPTGSQSSNRSMYDIPVDPLPLLPLESPTRFDGDSTDTETDRGDDEKLYKKIARLSMGAQSSNQNSNSPFGGPVYPPITTTSAPPPTISVVSYPQLMSQHQRTQGYAPSLQSMFIQPTLADVPQSTLLFDHAPPSDLYQNILPEPSQPVPNREPSQHSSNRAYMYGPREPTPSHSPYSNSPRPIVPPRPSQDSPKVYPNPPPPPSAPPPSAVVAPRIAPASSSERRDLAKRELKTVHFPREVLPRFLYIASVNTAKNRETCGLLLGKSKGSKFVVTTLLIPKQHSTSDTCTMDEEELVLEFTEKRSLITLGWIHTHPTQSCFMSSVDLHTHSGFQCMLPESFAVVCAPQHTPNFGIFRLTDPPGLQTILGCNSKDAFHPHPDLPIYTDADKGHVQMRDMALEIVDLR